MCVLRGRAGPEASLDDQCLGAFKAHEMLIFWIRPFGVLFRRARNCLQTDLLWKWVDAWRPRSHADLCQGINKQTHILNQGYLFIHRKGKEYYFLKCIRQDVLKKGLEQHVRQRKVLWRNTGGYLRLGGEDGAVRGQCSNTGQQGSILRLRTEFHKGHPGACSDQGHNVGSSELRWNHKSHRKRAVPSNLPSFLPIHPTQKSVWQWLGVQSLHVCCSPFEAKRRQTSGSEPWPATVSTWDLEKLFYFQ